MHKIVVAVISAALLMVPYQGLAKKSDDGERSLPPGLQKKVERGGELPPGWQKKLHPGEVLDEDVYDAGTVIRETREHEDVQVEDKIIRVIKSTRRITEILGTE